MQAATGAMTGYDGADGIATRNNVTCEEGRLDGFVAGNDAIRVSDRQHRAIDDGSGEVHYAVGRRVEAAVFRVQINATMAARVWGSRCDERPQHDVRGINGPLPGC